MKGPFWHLCAQVQFILITYLILLIICIQWCVFCLFVPFPWCVSMETVLVDLLYKKEPAWQKDITVHL